MIELKNTSYAYSRRGGKVLDRITASFAEGRVHGLLGRNGIGKSTLLKIICGLLIPQDGCIEVDGQISSRRQPSLLGKLFFVPEEFDLPAIPLATYVKRTAPLYPAFSAEAFDEHCHALDVNPGLRPDTLSMGGRKRAYLAFALACRTPYLLLDEPTNGLDIPSKAVFRRLLSAHADAGHTVVISTHQVADLQNIIDSIVILDEQGVALNASTMQIAERLRFGPRREGERELYCQERLGGTVCVAENAVHSDTAVDIELLFNATMQSRERVTEIMNR